MDPNDPDFLNYTDGSGAAGVLLDMEVGVYLTIATHKSAIFGVRCRAADTELIGRLIDAVGRASHHED